MAAFRKAVEAGARAIELDVHSTRDGVICVMHDETVDRTTDGSGTISEMTWKQLQALDAGGKHAREFAGEPVPRLDEVLDWAKDRCHVFIEVKPGPKPAGFSQQLVELIETRGMQSQVSVISFDGQAAREVERLSPQIQTGQLYSGQKLVSALKKGALVGLTAGGAAGCLAGPLGALLGGLGGAVVGALGAKWKATAELKAQIRDSRGELDMALPQWSWLTPGVVRLAQSQGQEVIPHTVNPSWCARFAAATGVDGIITDHPQNYSEGLNLNRRD